MNLTVEAATLTEEQQLIATAAVTDRVLVTAGPGTGKTHTAIARLEHLVEHEQVSPLHLLVLSFSRAAVWEIRRRLRDSDARYVRPLTFDSFATRLLARVEPDGDWVRRSYDGRIEAATKILGSQEAREELADITHLLVDEIQDLVGLRRRFVEDLLDHLSGNDEFGFTLLGDPAQGIYDFQLGDDDPLIEGAPALYRRLRADETVEELTLTVNHRAQSPGTKVALHLGDPLRTDEPDGPRIRGLLEDVVRGLPMLSGLEPLRSAVGSGQVGVLCRTNGQALIVSKELNKLEIEHRIQRHAGDRHVDTWLGRLLTVQGDSNLTRRKWESFHAAHFAHQAAATEERWNQLLAMGRVGRGTVSLKLVSVRLRRGQVPDDLQPAPDRNIVVSTVHRAKGLEFDHVVIVDRDWQRDDEDDSEEARILFVALSRAVKQLHRMPMPSFIGWLRRATDDDRWAVRGFQRWHRLGFEIKPGDIDFVFPPGHEIGLDPEVVQERLVERLRPDADVRFEFLREEGGFARYVVFVDDEPTAVTNEGFGWALRSAVRTSRNMRWPRALTEVRLDGVSSVGGDVNVAQASGLGRAAGWLVPRPVGMSRIEWNA